LVAILFDEKKEEVDPLKYEKHRFLVNPLNEGDEY
jgi:hypothetical protein